MSTPAAGRTLMVSTVDYHTAGEPFRIAITVIAATAGVPYRVFAPSVALSTAIWAAVGLWLGATVGEAIGNVLFDRGWIYIVGLGLVVVVLAVALVRAWRSWGARRALAG